jgi:exonuclease III
MNSSVKILSSNLWGLPWPFSKDKKQRFQEFVSFIDSKTPQILCLQEIWFKKEFKFLKEQFSKWKYKSFLKEGLIMNKGGLVTFSSFPIKKGEFMPFITGKIDFKGLKAKLLREEAFWPKGFLVVTIEIGRKVFAVINVHMTYLSRECDLQRIMEVKKAEIKQLFNFIESIKSDVDGIFVGGDFNIDFKKMPSIPKGLKVISDPSIPTLEKINPYAQADNYHGPDVVCDFILGSTSTKIVAKKTINSPWYPTIT